MRAALCKTTEQAAATTAKLLKKFSRRRTGDEILADWDQVLQCLRSLLRLGSPLATIDGQLLRTMEPIRIKMCVLPST
jgi:hypothetical protein